MEILFVRHGESEANLLELMYGSSDYHLTNKGEKQARSAGKIVDLMGFIPDEIYVSTLTRAQETLKNMGFDLNGAQKDERINERHLGSLEGINYHELHKNQPELFKEWNKDWLEYKPGGGESHLTFESRIVSFLTDLEEKHKNGERVLVVSHGGTMKIIFAHIFKSNPEHFFNIEIHNCSIMRVTKSKERYVFDALYNIHNFEEFAVSDSVENDETTNS
ncbi:MAG: histidine phosphatase family protein [Clostridium sp.]|nr:histidine phosphatase family protein [Clostridium sp.]